MTTLDRSTPWGCFFAVTVLLAGAANAQGQRPTAPSDSARHWRLALADAVALALQHNPMLKARAIDVRMAQARVVETSGRDDVVLSAKAAWLTDANQQATGGLVQNPYDAFQVQTQLVRPLPTGGTIGLQLESAYTRFRSDRLGPEVPSQWITPSIALTLRHPILRGAGTAVVRAEQRSARAQKSVAVLQEEAFLADLLRQVCQAYWGLHYATVEVAVRRASLDLAQEQLRAVQAAMRVGNKPSSASAEVEVAIAMHRADMLTAEQARRQQSTTLRRLLGLAVGEHDPVFVAADTPTVDRVEPTVADAMAKAMQRHPDLLALQQQGRVAAIAAEVAEDALLPQLDLAVSGGPTGNADSADAALSGLFQLSGYQFRASLTFAHPLGRHAATGRAAAARAARQRLRWAERDIRDRLRADVVATVDRVVATRSQIEVLARATRLAELDLTAARARYAAGRAQGFDVLRRQAALAEAQLREARARVDYVGHRITLEAFTAEILERIDGTRLGLARSNDERGRI